MKCFLLPVWLKMSVSRLLAPLTSISPNEISINFSDYSLVNPLYLGLPQYVWYKIFLRSVLLWEGLKAEVNSLLTRMMGKEEFEKFNKKEFTLLELKKEETSKTDKKSEVFKNSIYCAPLERDWSHINGKHPN